MISSDRRLGKIRERCDVLFEVMKVLRPLYLKASLDQRNFLETIIGAAIWYIPAPQDAWTGYISVEALKIFQNKDTRHIFSQEHVIPRKIAARELFTRKKITSVVLTELFYEKYCKVHYVTSKENKILMRFQRNPNFLASPKTYKDVGITLIKVTKSEFQSLRQGNLATIKKLLKSKT